MDQENLNFTCRGCLIVEQKAILHSLDNVRVLELFTNCTGIQINTEEHYLPMQICSLCFGRCENWESFRSMCGLNEKQLRLNAGADCPEEMDELGLSIEVDDSQFEDDSKTVIEVEESTEENTNDDDNDDEPDDEIPRSANHSEVQEVFICDHCGKCIRGRLALKKHTLQHELRIEKRVRLTKVASRVKELYESVSGEDSQLLVQSWTNKERKRLRDSGQAYINTRAAVVSKKSVQSINCDACVYKCSLQIPPEVREQIFNQYWSMGFANQRSFLNDNVLERKCGFRRGSRRQFTLEYSFNQKRVCKKFFCGTLDISDRAVMCCKMKARNNMDVTVDLRGTKRKK